MKTARRIVEIVSVIAAVVIAAVVLTCAAVGLGPGLLWSTLAIVLVISVYQQLLKPWHSTWGATPAEVAATLPGDQLVVPAASTTRAIAISSTPEQVWPWLVQLGFGRAGWYSYDWIDNDGAPSAPAIVAELQDLAVGDRIPMTPDLGFVVDDLVPATSIVSLSDDATTSWVLHLEADDDGGCRLVSRFRAQPVCGVAGAVWAAVAGPGAFIMERRMLLGIRRRAEQSVLRASRS